MPSLFYDRGMQRYDVLVVGAGPAGSATAIHLARGGAHVLLADRARFPRDKPCGGGVTGRALRQAPCDITPVVERVVDTFELRLHHRRSFRRTSARAADPDDPASPPRRIPRGAGGRGGRDVPGRRTRRAPRDRRGRGHGDRRRQAGRRRRPRRRRRRQRRRREGGRARRRHRARRRARGERPVGAARPRPLRVHGRDRARRSGRRLRLAVPQGRPREPRRRRLGGTRGRACAGTSPGSRAPTASIPDALTDVRGHRLPMRRLGASTPARDRVLLVGDAAGLVDPLSGDGMYEAFTSARLAAEAILAGEPASYPAALARALDHHAGASWTAKRALDRYPAVCFWAARSPGRVRRRRRPAAGRRRAPGRGAGASPARRCGSSRASPAGPEQRRAHGRCSAGVKVAAPLPMLS